MKKVSRYGAAMHQHSGVNSRGPACELIMRGKRHPIWLLKILAAILLVYNSGSFASTACSHRIPAPITDTLFGEMGLYSDLVIQGEILRAEIAKIDAGPYFRPVDSDGKSEAIEILLRVSRCISGEYGDSTIAVIIPQGEIGYRTADGRDTGLEKLHSGDSVIIGLNYGYTSRDLYVLGDRPFFLRIDGARLVPYSDEYYVESKNPIEILVDAARKRDLAYLYNGAEIVCLAKLVRNDKSVFSLSLKIDRVIKGLLPSKTIELDYRRDFAMWDDKEPELLLFLKETNGIYRLSAGMNSVYTIRGEKLLRNGLPLMTTLPKAQRVFMKAEAADHPACR